MRTVLRTQPIVNSGPRRLRMSAVMRKREVVPAKRRPGGQAKRPVNCTEGNMGLGAKPRAGARYVRRPRMVPPQKLHITAAAVGCYAVRKQLCVATDRGTLYDMRSGPAQSETHARTHGQLLGFRAEVCLLAGPRIMGAARTFINLQRFLDPRITNTQFN